jgi:hypothetical protein
LFGSIGMFSFGPDTTLRFYLGMAEVRHVYEHDIAPTVPHASWPAHAMKMGWTTTSRPIMFPPMIARFLPGSFGYSSGHVLGVSDGKTVSPARYSVTHVPLWAVMLPGVILGARLVRRWRNERRLRGRGFSVTQDPRPAMPVAPDPAPAVHS